LDDAVIEAFRSLADQAGGEDYQTLINEALVEHLRQRSMQAARQERGTAFLYFLEEEVWPQAPSGQLGRRLSREEEDEILGYAPDYDEGTCGPVVKD
jgi:hypothetical protein